MGRVLNPSYGAHWKAGKGKREVKAGGVEEGRGEKEGRGGTPVCIFKFSLQ